MDDLLLKLQDWYVRCCNGDWEHAYGITIKTLDNPGWLVTVDLNGTKWETATWEALRWELSEQDWIVCSKKGTEFQGSGDPSKLEAILKYFLSKVTIVP